MSLSSLIASLGQLLTLAIVLGAILSWFPPSATLAPVVRFLDTVTSPIMRPLRRALPTLGGIDFSPIVALILIGTVVQIVVSVLHGH